MLLSHKELSFLIKTVVYIQCLFYFRVSAFYLQDGKSVPDARRKFNSRIALLKDYTICR